MVSDPIKAAKDLVASTEMDIDKRLEIQTLLCQATREIINKRTQVTVLSAKEEAYRDVIDKMFLLILDRL